jgi:hypothetical protein
MLNDCFAVTVQSVHDERQRFYVHLLDLYGNEDITDISSLLSFLSIIPRPAYESALMRTSFD